ncbi:formylglycine-generating enzyme family protein [Natronospora cellulosivora (SeqCode)]
MQNEVDLKLIINNHNNNYTYKVESKDIYTVDSKNNKVVFKVIYTENISEMIFVPAGTTSEENANLRLDYDIYIGKYPVTFQEYIEFTNVTEKNIPDDNGWGKDTRPVINVSWYDALEYCNWLSIKDGLEPAYDLSSSNRLDWDLRDDPENIEGYRLPSAEEWEFAARGGTNGEATTFSGSDNLEEVGWSYRNSGDEWMDRPGEISGNNNRTHPVGLKLPNELGIYDMSGNVHEWTSTKVAETAVRTKGGSWNISVTVSNGYNQGISAASTSIGFRVIKTATQ